MNSKILKGIILTSLLLTLASCTSNWNQKDIQIIPEPSSTKFRQGNINVSGASYWIDKNIDEASVAAIRSFFDRLGTASCSDCFLAESKRNSVFVFETDSSLDTESYRIDAGRKQIKIYASSFSGFIYAIETLKQLLPVEIYSGQSDDPAIWSVPRIKIDDCPRFHYRGMHLDAARHFWSVEQVKRYLDIMAIHKINTFHWHLSDDQGWRVEIKKYPELTETGSKRKHTALGRGWNNIEYDGIPYEGHYTQEDIREVVAYASSKGITIIPEIDLPGHMLAAIASYPELGCTGGPYEVWGRWGISSDVLCVGKESTFDFIEDVLSEITSLFPSKYIHIGGDECPKVRWRECEECRARMQELGLDPDDPISAELLQGYVTNRVQKFLEEHDRQIIGWDEILAGDISSSAVIMSWRGTDGGIAASQAGHDVIMVPNIYLYLDYYQSRKIQEEPFAIGGFVNVEKVYSFEPYTEEMTEEQKSHILGVQANLWTEYIADEDHLYYMLLPRMSALSEVQWCSVDNRSYQQFLDKMTHMLEIYRTLGYNFGRHIFEVTPIIGVDFEKECPVVELTTQGNAPMYYTLDGSIPTIDSTPYTVPVSVKDGEVFKAIVDRTDMETKVFSQNFVRHKSMGKNITMRTQPSPMHAAGLPGSLVNGVVNEGENAGGGEWMAWYGDPIDVVIDMAGETYDRVSVRAFVSKWEDLFPPLGITVSTSDDGTIFNEIATLPLPQETAGVPDGVNAYDVTFPETSARFLNVVVKTVPALPEWSERPGRPAYLFIDEIKVE